MAPTLLCKMMLWRGEDVFRQPFEPSLFLSRLAWMPNPARMSRSHGHNWGRMDRLTGSSRGLSRT
ncbi:hypothetical protein L209DRAFT_753979 [Thermothelomyces heterothallicus CBS 203.75]